MQKIHLILCTIFFICSCNNTPTPATSTTSNNNNDSNSYPVINKTIPDTNILPDIKYILLTGKDTIKKLLRQYNDSQKKILCAINRVDNSHLLLLDTILLADKLDTNVEQYLPFPNKVPSLNSVHKIIFFSYPAQVFAAYENGNLIYTGQTNMGRRKNPTPTGLFFTNWKAKKTISTVNDEWVLKWNFNIENKEGIGFHQYALPGYPASHSCLRLIETDAKFLYNWADQWILKDAYTIIAKGTPVIVFGNYPFGTSKPWYQLVTNSHALDISDKALEGIITPYLQKIMEAQNKRTI